MIYFLMYQAVNSGLTPHARAAHATATVRLNQMLVYGGSIGSKNLILIIIIIIIIRWTIC